MNLGFTQSIKKKVMGRYKMGRGGGEHDSLLQPPQYLFYVLLIRY
jgi:hypothetical protein